MKNRNTRSLAVSIAFALLLIPVFAGAALPFTVKPGHPRVYLDQAQVDKIRAEIQKEQGFNGADFEQGAGTLSFDMFVPPPPSSPALWPNTIAGFWPNYGVFDDADPLRNHVFVRHRDRTDSNGYYPCGGNNTDQAAIQVGFQQGGATTFYSREACVRTNSWVTVSVYWNTQAPQVGYSVTSNEVRCVTGCSGSSTSVPPGWKPDQQRFRFTGRAGYNAGTGQNDVADRFDNIRFYSSDTLSAASLVANFTLNEGVGIYAADVSGNGHAGRLESQVKWATRSSSDPDPVIEINGVGYPFTVIADSPVVDIWPSFRKLADQYANEFNNSGTLSYDPLTGTIIGGVLSGNPATGHEGVPRNYARILGLAWMLTSDPKFASAALKYADLLINIPVSAGYDSTRAARIEAMGLLYDYLYNVEEMRAKHGQFVRKVKEMVAKYEPNGTTGNPVNSALCGPGYYFTLGDTVCRGWYNPPYLDQAGPSLTIGNGHNHSINAALSTGIFGLLDAPDAELESVLYMTHANFVNGFNPARAWIAVDGGFHMSWNYSAAYNELSFILAWNTATDLDMTADWQNKLIYMYLYALRGDFNFPCGGDGCGSANFEFVKPFAWWGSLNAADGYAQRYYRRWLMPTFSHAFFELVLGRAGLPESPLEELPYSRLFRNAGRVLMRDSWDYTNATLVEFKSASFYHLGHDHMDQNAFSVFYKAPLLVDSGFHDGMNTLHWNNYSSRSIAHNLVTVWDPTECFAPTFPSDYGCASNDGGQKHFPIVQPSLAAIQDGGSNHLDGVTAYEYTPAYTYTVGNASKAYNSNKLDQSNGFIRSLVNLRTPSFWSKPVTVAFDKVTASPAGAGLTKRFLLQTVNEPVEPGGNLAGPGIHTLSDSIIEIRNGGGMLFSQTLLPENAVITKIGGKSATTDYRFLAPSKTATDYYAGMVNFPPTSDPDASTTDAIVSADMGRWRVEVTSPLSTQREYFFHVFSVADNGAVTAPPAAQNLTSSDAAVVLLADTQIVAFSKNDQPATTISWDSPVMDANMIVGGMVPDTAFDAYVIRNGTQTVPYTVVIVANANGLLRSSSQGVVLIDAPLPVFAADLIPAALSASRSGGNLLVNDRVKNQGNYDADEFDVGFYLSNDTTLETETDLFLCKRAVAALAPGSSDPASGTVRTICPTPVVPDGFYYVLALDDAENVVAEGNETNNTGATSTALHLGADLVPNAISIAKSGDMLTLRDRVKNRGTAPSGPFAISFYLSLDTVYDAADFYVCSREVAALGAGFQSPTSGTIATTCAMPASVPAGTYHAIVVEDAAGAIVESNESNNVMVSTSTIKK